MEALNTYKTEKTLAEQMNERLAEMKMTKAEAALKMNYSRAALSQYLNGKYASDPTELEKKVREFLAATGGVAEGQEPENSVPTGAGTLKKKVEFFESRDFVQTIGVCQACQEYMGLEDYVLSDEHYGKKDLFVIDRKSGINTIAEVNSSWGIKNPFFFQKKVFYWGTKEEQKEIYVLEEGETILSLNKYGDLWEAETIAIPWIHHSQEVEVQHSKYSGIVTVEKTIVRSDDTGAVHMYIYFAGGEKDV